jgi:hypothetical protein
MRNTRLQSANPRKGTVFNLGFFSKPFIPSSGPDKGKIIKFYRPLKDEALCRIVAEHHDRYVLSLRKAGIRVPRTGIRLEKARGKTSLVIVQDAFRETELVRGRFAKGNTKECLWLLEALLSDTLKFLSLTEKLRENLGFHPTLRNYAVRDGRLWYFDTFPPMNWNQKDLNGIVIRFAPFAVFRIAYALSKDWIRRVTDEYYHPVPMICGIVGSACRLRPDIAPALMESARKFLGSRIKDRTLKTKVLKELSKPPRLPFMWTFLRGLVGKEGRPNIR